MEAKELDRLLACAELRNPQGFSADRERYLAEISFKAGWEQGWNDNKPYLPDTNEPWDREQTVFNDGKQVGRQEVFDFLHKNSAAVMMNEYALKAQLEKWGIFPIDEEAR